ncbi:unnamed protein product [Fraxinus pennsylvanica]|uniref:Uncharacterized protein n=1 Tax=Fraxinus pennsylvanica TaxID=56036 RepID=A0AAD2AGG2_9LAMI|nr:unnamed protein product [Fraxinus pennsylvanica]
MKWTTLLKEFKEKVGFSLAPPASSSPSDSNNNVNRVSPSSQDYELLHSWAAHAMRTAKELTVTKEDKNLNDGHEASSFQKMFSNFPQDQVQLAMTSSSTGSFSQGHHVSSSEDVPAFSNIVAGEKSETVITTFQQQLDKSVKEDEKSGMIITGEAVDHVSNATSGSKKFTSHDTSNTPDQIHHADSQGSPSFATIESPILSERSNSRISFTPSPVLALTSWVGDASHNGSKGQLASNSSLEFSTSVNEINSSSDLKMCSQDLNILCSISPKLLLEVDDSGYGGGPCSAAASAVLDFMAVVPSDLVTEQIKAAKAVETILESVPLYVDAESVLIFQGLCLTRLMNFLERRLLRDDEENEKRLDKSRRSLNFDALS